MYFRSCHKTNENHSILIQCSFSVEQSLNFDYQYIINKEGRENFFTHRARKCSPLSPSPSLLKWRWQWRNLEMLFLVTCLPLTVMRRHYHGTRVVVQLGSLCLLWRVPSHGFHINFDWPSPLCLSLLKCSSLVLFPAFLFLCLNEENPLLHLKAELGTVCCRMSPPLWILVSFGSDVYETHSVTCITVFWNHLL